MSIFKGAKTAHDMFLTSGLLTYFSIGDAVSMAKGGIDVVGAGITNSYNQSEDQFRETGEGIAEILGSGAMAAANMDMLWQTATVYGRKNTLLSSRFKAPNVYEAKGILKDGKIGEVYTEMNKGGFTHVGNMVDGKFNPVTSGKWVAEEDTVGRVLSAARKTEVANGYIQELNGASKFIKGHSFVRGIAPFAAAIGFNFVAKSILGFAGGIVDEAMRDHHREKAVYYDNRFFNTERDEMSNFNALGAAMNNYEARFQSTARIYHSR